jgi:hypothetical protein
MECLHHSRYKYGNETFTSFSLLDSEKGHWLLKNPEPHKNLRHSEVLVTRCGSGSDTGVEHGFQETPFLKLPYEWLLLGVTVFFYWNSYIFLFFLPKEKRNGSSLFSLLIWLKLNGYIVLSFTK